MVQLAVSRVVFGTGAGHGAPVVWWAVLAGRCQGGVGLRLGVGAELRVMRPQP